MTTSKKIQTTELDFDGIKASFKEYLRGQPTFTDYDFEGSGLSTLLDVLAYNTHYNALYLNLAVNESFLDSASKRASVVSKAKELGYVPNSGRAATALIDLLFINNNTNAPEFVELPQGTPFTATVDNQQYTFTNVDSLIAYKNDNQYLFTDVVLREGTPLEFRYEVADRTSYVIPNPNVDTTTIQVLVQESGQTSAFEVFSLADTILTAGPTTPIYFLKEIEGGLYEVEFGNGLVGKQLSPGNIVTIRYLVCSFDQANGARSFVYNGQLTSQPFVTTKAPAYGGAQPESIEDIKWSAPRAYAAQNRCVTLDDYKTIVLSQYPNAQSVNVWGGEQNDPPTYGDVYISIKPVSGDTLSQSEKEFILNDVIGKRKITTVHPKIVDAAFIDVELNTTFYFNRSSTTRTPSDLALAVRQSIATYNTTNLNRFDGVLKYSNLSKVIDEADPAITSSITTLRLHREILPAFNQQTTYTINLGNPIHNAGGAEESILSSAFTVLNTPRTVYIDDVSDIRSDRGTLRMFFYSNGEKIVVRNIGYVEYSKGIIVIENLIVTGLVDPSLKLIIKPQSNDVASIRNQIVSIRPELTKVTPMVETDTNSYKFTSSRN